MTSHSASGSAVDVASNEAIRRLLDAKLDFSGLTSEAEVFEGIAHLPPDTKLRDAAVLIPIITREAGPMVLLTQRPETMASHPGQVAFPGGRIDPDDAGPIEAALREAEEEVGLSSALADVRGALEPMATGTGFRIVPIVALIDSTFEAAIDPVEVAEAFEVPFAFLMDPANHLYKTSDFGGRQRSYYEMPYEGYRIWGATARIIVDLHRKLFL